MCGRIANFINGELYGRIANGVAWAVKFPDALSRSEMPEFERFNKALAAAVDADPAFAKRIGEISAQGYEDPRAAQFHELITANRESYAVSEAIAPYLDARHPSQLYEALLEGLLLFAILWFVRVRFPKAPHGLLTGLFFLLYPTFRIFAEAYREPDAAWVIEGMLTQGQFLSLFMYLFAAAFLIFAFRKSRAAV
jgi:phosphatidylglycerol:prolipoprotein diacylglycerol transferase